MPSLTYTESVTPGLREIVWQRGDEEIASIYIFTGGDQIEFGWECLWGTSLEYRQSLSSTELASLRGLAPASLLHLLRDCPDDKVVVAYVDESVGEASQIYTNRTTLMAHYSRLGFSPTTAEQRETHGSLMDIIATVGTLRATIAVSPTHATLLEA